MPYPEAAWAMTVQEVLLKAINGELYRFRAADTLEWSPRTLRRWRERYEAHGYSGLIDKRLLRRRGFVCRPDTTSKCWGSCPRAECATRRVAHSCGPRLRASATGSWVVGKMTYIAERVGFVPVVPAPVNNLGRFQSLKSLETLKS